MTHDFVLVFAPGCGGHGYDRYTFESAAAGSFKSAWDRREILTLRSSHAEREIIGGLLWISYPISCTLLYELTYMDSNMRSMARNSE